MNSRKSEQQKQNAQQKLPRSPPRNCSHVRVEETPCARACGAREPPSAPRRPFGPRSCLRLLPGKRPGTTTGTTGTAAAWLRHLLHTAMALGVFPFSFFRSPSAILVVRDPLCPRPYVMLMIDHARAPCAPCAAKELRKQPSRFHILIRPAVPAAQQPSFAHSQPADRRPQTAESRCPRAALISTPRPSCRVDQTTAAKQSPPQHPRTKALAIRPSSVACKVQR